MKRPILNYHAVGSTQAPDLLRWTISPELFKSHLDLLVATGLRGVSVAEALADPSPEQVVLTFDDGYEDFATIAAPELEARGFSASLFVVTGDVGDQANWLTNGSRPMASWEQLRFLDGVGFEIGAHSHTHRQLDLLPPHEVQEEITKSRLLLRTNLEHDIAGFCYPHGFYTSAVRQAVINAGFSYACAVKHKMSCATDDRYALARIIVGCDTPPERLAQWLEGRSLRRRSPRIERPLAAALRAYRRTQLLRS